jgi:hypothetical protein
VAAIATLLISSMFPMLIWGPRLIQVRGNVWRVIYLPQQKSHGVNLGPRAI